jgi:voltage-gated potassium channel Kch
MVSLLNALARFWFAIRLIGRDPSFRLLATLTASLLLVGTLVFHRVEGWSYFDSFYFSAITLATVGYGDFTPQTAAGKLLTIFYIFSGVGLLVALLTRFADVLIQSEHEDRKRRRLQMRDGEKKDPCSTDAAHPDPAEPPMTQEKHLP